MKILHTQLAKQPATLAKTLFNLERRGRYEEAIFETKGVWDDVSKAPQVEECDAKISAEIFLRCGAVIGFLGHNKQIPNSQSRSKDLLTEARHRFLELYDAEKIAECENYLALAYWRTGELNEAETWIEEAFSHQLPISNYAILYAHISKCLLFIAENKYSKIISYIQHLEKDFLLFGDECLNGDFYNALGIAFNESGNQAKALEYFKSARFHYQKSQHKISLGIIENNLAQFYKIQENFGEAHKMIDCSTKSFRQIKDRTREGFSLDTKAQIFFAELKYTEALQIVEKACKILTKSENKAYLVETLLTRVKCLLFLDDFIGATLCLTDAVQIARVHISESAARNLIKDFEIALQAKNLPVVKEYSAPKESVAENFELILPVELSHYNEIQAIRIQNQNLESVGLKQGSLAIVALESVRRGDLIAISEKATEAASCGFYDADFGFVCLETINNEPQLFDENEIEILGKIVGVCYSEKNADGKLIVEAIHL